MDKAYLKRLDESEDKRVRDIINQRVNDGTLETSNRLEVFKNRDLINKLLSANNLPFVTGFDPNIVPILTIFGDAILLEICPLCECVKDFSMLEPFLERGLIVPALSTQYADFSPKFIEKLSSYPHFSVPEYLIYRNTFFSTKSRKQSESGFVCETCIQKRNQEASELIGELEIDNRAKHILADSLNLYSFPALQPYMYPDYLILDEILKVLREKNVEKYWQIFRIIECINQLRTSQAYKATPQINIKNLELVKGLLSKKSEIKMNYEIMEIKESVMKGLKLYYSPSSPIDTYLDIIQPRKQRISNIVTKIIEKADPESETFLSDLQKEIERVNQEVTELKASKRAKILNFSTNFITKNKGLVSGCILAASMGLAGAGLAACGVAGAGLLSKAVGKYAQVTLPEETKKLGLVLEPQFENLLSTSLSQDIETIQVWRLQNIISKKEV